MIHLTYTHHAFLQQRFGGVSRYFYELAMRAAQAADFDVSIVAPFFVNEYLRGAPRALIRGMPMPEFEFRGAWRIRKRIHQLSIPCAYLGARTADVIHETYYSTAPYGDATRRVTTVHDMIYELFPAQYPPGVAAAASAAKRASVSRADHVICVSEATRRDLVRLMEVDPAKTTVIHHGVSLSPESGSGQALAGDRPYLLYVGARSDYKNFAGLCAAYAASASLQRHVELVAFGGGKFSADELAMFSRLGIQGKVRHGDGGDQQLGAFYRGALAFVYPSLYEGFGFPPLEAMACQCPVVCSNTSSIPEVVGDAGLYFDPAEVEDMRQALERIADDGNLRERLVSAGRARAALFSWERCGSQTMDIYRSLG